MYYGNIEKFDVANGPGIRTLLFVSGCTHKCKGCHNKDSQDFNYGDLFTEETTDLIIEHLSSPMVEGFSLLGGEPFDNADECIKLLKEIRKIHPKKSIWVWSGYTYEKMLTKPTHKQMIELCDVLIDGRFVEKLKDVRLDYRGSSNQRVIDTKASLEENKVILYQK